MTPHDILLEVLHNIIDFALKGGTKEIITIIIITLYLGLFNEEIKTILLLSIIMIDVESLLLKIYLLVQLNITLTLF